MPRYIDWKVVSVDTYQSRAAPARWSSAMIFSVAKKRSAIIPTKKGETMAATAVVP